MTSNALALPTSHASAESQLAQLLQRACGDGPNAQLEISRSISGGWSLTASSELTADALARAIGEAVGLDMFAVPSDETEIEFAVVRLKATTNRPVWMDAEDSAAYEAALIEACTEYPIDVVDAACKAWRQVPGQGRWWPTEQDLRQLCDALYAPRQTLLAEALGLLMSLREQERPPREQSEARRAMAPYGRTRQFVDRVRQDTRFGQAFVKSYLSDRSCDFTDTTIFVAYSVQHERIVQRCTDILRAFPDVRIVLDRQTTERCNRDLDAMGIVYTPPSQKRKQS